MKRLTGKPFALLGVNSDANKEIIPKRKKKDRVTWRSFWNGPKGMRGPISKEWGVVFWPTVYVIDPQGVIRYKNVKGKALDDAVDSLLAKLNRATL